MWGGFHPELEMKTHTKQKNSEDRAFFPKDTTVTGEILVKVACLTTFLSEASNI